MKSTSEVDQGAAFKAGAQRIVDLPQNDWLPTFIEDENHNQANYNPKMFWLIDFNRARYPDHQFSCYASGTASSVIPKFIENKIKGYCSFLYSNDETHDLKYMITDQASYIFRHPVENIKINTEQNIRRGFKRYTDDKLIRGVNSATFLISDIGSEWASDVAIHRTVHHFSLIWIIWITEKLIRYISIVFPWKKAERSRCSKNPGKIVVVLECTSSENLFKSSALIKKLWNTVPSVSAAISSSWREFHC